MTKYLVHFTLEVEVEAEDVDEALERVIDNVTEDMRSQYFDIADYFTITVGKEFGSV